MGGGGRNRIPIFRNRVFRQVEIDRRDTGDRIHALRLGMASKLHAVARVVAGNMCNHRCFSLCLCHHIFQRDFTLLYTLVDTFPGRTAHIQALHALADQMPCQRAGTLRADLPRIIVASVKSGNHAPIFL